MTDKKTWPVWVLLEAAKRSEWGEQAIVSLVYWLNNNGAFRALCDMIERYEQPPVDRKLLCAREACLEQSDWFYPNETRKGRFDENPCVRLGLRAIQLHEEGFGK
jgi:hypothetical protein